MEDVFVGVGVPKEDAETIADVLITADWRLDSTVQQAEAHLL